MSKLIYDGRDSGRYNCQVLSSLRNLKKVMNSKTHYVKLDNVIWGPLNRYQISRVNLVIFTIEDI